MRLEHLPGRWRQDPYLLGEHADAEVLAAWTADDALLAVLRGAGHGSALVGLGDPSGIAGLAARAVREASDALAETGHATVRRGAFDALAPDTRSALGYADAGSAWDWMWTPQPLSADPGGAQRLPLGTRTSEEVAACLARAHPTASTAPDDARIVGWWGVREAGHHGGHHGGHQGGHGGGHGGGRLVAVVGALLPAPGLPPHLVSLGVDPATRGQGLAGAVVSAAVRDCLEVQPATGPRMVTLGLYASNDVARRVYLRLGFRLHHRFETHRRELAGRS